MEKNVGNMGLEAKFRKNFSMISAKNYLVVDRDTLGVVAERNSD